MQVLELRQLALAEGRYRVEAILQRGGVAPLTASGDFSFSLSIDDRERLRWYLEDYLLQPGPVEKKIAERIESKLIKQVGVALFKAVFDTQQGQRLWGKLEDELAQTRVEVKTDVAGSTAIPWELLREPRTDAVLALRARSFVRVQSETAVSVRVPDTAAEDGPIRILLVICRPGRDSDVPFRSVASRLVKCLKASDREHLQLEVLRPATYARLAMVLRAAEAEGKPYHIVHFDGHGAFLELPNAEESTSLGERMRQMLRSLAPTSTATYGALLLSEHRPGAHGYLVFENPGVEDNLQLVDGPALGRLLYETQVSALVLNACRSAHAEPPSEPQVSVEDDDEAGDGQEDRVYGSLAHEVIDQGVPGVVAMRHNVYVVTAAQFVANLYTALVAGRSLGEAMAAGRKQLADQPLRTIAYKPVPLRDWSVPIVYEHQPIQLFPDRSHAAPTLRIKIDSTRSIEAVSGREVGLPPQPDVGFIGRDSTILALDRAFDSHQVVLLHAYAGSGKTTTAVEFARWYELTGGLNGPVLFTSFEQYRPLARVLDTLGQVFGATLEANKVNWLALDDARRRDVALKLLGQVPVIWVWDNVEPVTGFPKGAPTAFSEEEQRELADFLRAARGTKAKFLLTSRRDERDWLGELPRRIAVGPMPFQERVELARALMDKHGRSFTDVESWRSLLEFTGGNPLTLNVVVGQAARDGLRKKAAIEAYVACLRSGQAQFQDEVAEGRSRSLGASLQYGFEVGFSEDERRRLAVLALFQGFVDVHVLVLLGNPERPGCLEEVRGIGRGAWMALLDRAAEVGLLRAYSGGYYRVHPALPWFLRVLFERHYPRGTGCVDSSAQRVELAWVKAMGDIGNSYMMQFDQGNPHVIYALKAEEENLLHAWRIACRNAWLDSVTRAMQGLKTLYGLTGRRREWTRLVEAVVPYFVDPGTDAPLLGCEDDWFLVTQSRVRIARELRDWEGAERLQRASLDWVKRRAEPLIARPPLSLDGDERTTVRNLAASWHELGQIQRERCEGSCISSYEEALRLSAMIGELVGAATCAYNLGHAYKDLPSLRDLDAAERWFRKSLGLTPESDRLARGKCVGMLGNVELDRLEDARTAERPEAELLEHLKAALRLYHQALDLTPANAVNELAVKHDQLGRLYAIGGQLDRSLMHSRKALAYAESAGDRFSAAQTQENVAIHMLDAGHLDDALDYAHGALKNFEHYGDRAAPKIEETRELIDAIEQARKSPQ